MSIRSPEGSIQVETSDLDSIKALGDLGLDAFLRDLFTANSGEVAPDCSPERVQRVIDHVSLGAFPVQAA